MEQTVQPAAVPEQTIPPTEPAALPDTQSFKPKWKLQPHDTLFALLALPLGFLFIRYILFKADGFLTTGFFLLLYLFSCLYIRKSGCKPKPVHHLMGAVIIAFSLVFSLTAAPLIHGLCVLFLLPAIVWRTHAVCSGTGLVTRYLPFDLWDSCCSAPLWHASAGPQAYAELTKKSKSAGNAKAILLGLLVTIPLTAVVAVLLSSADEGVNRMLSDVFEMISDNVYLTVLEILLAIPAGIWLFGMLYSAAQRKLNPLPDEAYHEQKLLRARIIPNAGLYAGVTPICVLYLLYVVSQTNYFLSAFAGKLPSDMIYSEYARRGFFELCAIAIINLAVILVLTGCAKKGGNTRPKLLTGYAVMLCLFTLFIIATAIAKMVLYINAYGLTALRLYTAWFMVLLGVVFLTLLVKQFVRRLPTAAILTVSFTLLFGLLCFAMPEQRIAEYNITRYENGTLSELDVDMLCGLSEDAYLVMTKHPDALRRAGQWDEFVRRAKIRTDEIYRESKDKSWNLPAQILIQRVHVDIPHEE